MCIVNRVFHEHKQYKNDNIDNIVLVLPIKINSSNKKFNFEV